MVYAGGGLLDPWALLERAGLVEGCTVADLGCGALGHFVFPAAEMVGASGRVYAVDVARATLRRIEDEARREQYWHVQPIWSDVEHHEPTPVPSNTVDLTLIVNALYLASQPERWAKEALRMTRPGGQALIVDWHPTAQPLGPTTDLRLDPSTVHKAFAQQGWLVEEDTIIAGDHHFGLLCVKPESVPEVRVEFISHPLN